MEKIIPISEKEAVVYFYKYNFSHQLLNRIEVFLFEKKFGFKVDFSEILVYNHDNYINICSEPLNKDNLGIFHYALKECFLILSIFNDENKKKSCIISPELSYIHFNGGRNGCRLNFYFIGNYETGLLEVVYRE